MGNSAYADRDTVLAALAAAESAAAALAGCRLDGFTPEELLDVLARRQALAWAAPAFDHTLTAHLAATADPGVLGAASLKLVLAERLRISRRAAARRLAEAADLGPRTSLDGQPLEPRLPTLAAAVAAGAIGPEHVDIARDIYRQLPANLDPDYRQAAEADLAGLATQFAPEQYRTLAAHLLTILDPDGDYQERARRAQRGLTLGPQRRDGMSALRGTLTPEARATLEPILAKLAAPGMCNPNDEHPCVSGTPSQEQISADQRSAAQRGHDALIALSRAVLAAGDLGKLNGLPVTVVITTTLAELQTAAATHPDATPNWTTTNGNNAEENSSSNGGADSTGARAPGGNGGDGDTGGGAGGGSCPPGSAALGPAPALNPDNGWAITAGGTRVPMRDLLRMASHAYHYLSIFDGHGRALWLGRSKRLATADQRLVLFSRERGCTRPGCPEPFYRTQAHHLDPWTPKPGTTSPPQPGSRGDPGETAGAPGAAGEPDAAGGNTNIDDLALACRADNNMADKFDWTTIRNTDGRVEWIPPPALDRGQPRTNTINFPEQLLARYRKLRGAHPDQDLPPQDEPHWLDQAIDAHRRYDTDPTDTELTQQLTLDNTPYPDDWNDPSTWHKIQPDTNTDSTADDTADNTDDDPGTSDDTDWADHPDRYDDSWYDNETTDPDSHTA
ncbi:HNH endonuclease signature motif containing protein [Mycolicibacterium fallax]|nr:HNH endonuclease signature motif containing protein [Mycolicibacterium fallax]